MVFRPRGAIFHHIPPTLDIEHISSVQFWWDIYVTENIGKQLYTEKSNQFNSV